MVVPNGDNGPIVEVAAGLNHSLARDDAGRVWAWGSNEYGQLGLSDNNNGKDDEHVVAPTPTGARIALPSGGYLRGRQSQCHPGRGWEGVYLR